MMSSIKTQQVAAVKMSAINTSLKLPSSTFEHDPDMVVDVPNVDDDPSDSEEREER